MAPQKRKLTHDEKRQLIEYKRRHLEVTQKELAEWAKQQFNLREPPAQSSISVLLSNQDAVLARAATKTPSVDHPVQHTEFDRELEKWVGLMELNMTLVTPTALAAQAETIVTQLSLDRTATLFDGWMASFCERHGLDMRKGHRLECADPSATRRTLTPPERQQIRDHFSRHPDMTQAQLARWAMRVLQLSKPPTQSSISTLLKQGQSQQDIPVDTAPASNKHVRPPRFPALDRALLQWIYYCQSIQLVVRGESIRERAMIFSDMLDLGTDRPTFSNSWVQSFRARYKFAKNPSPEGGIARVGAVPIPVTTNKAVMEAVAAYNPQDVFAMDELCLFYELEPDSNLATCDAVGRQRKITAVLCTNATGMERLDPFYICECVPHETSTRTAETQPTTHQLTEEEAFQRFCSNALGEIEAYQDEARDGTKSAHPAPYGTNQKAWFTTPLFRKWLRSFNASMRCSERKVALLIDSTVTHNYDGLELSNVQVITTSLRRQPRLHPLASEVARSLRRRYRLRHFKHVLKKNLTIPDFSIPTQLAIEWTNQSWQEVPLGIIVSGFRNAGVFVMQLSMSENEEKALEDDILTCIQRLSCPNPMPLNQLVDSDAEYQASNFIRMSDRDCVDSAIESSDQLPQDTALLGFEARHRQS
ncbi:TPA: hypothetical protein N0F65_001289 [Lagenidium giganteum]|uniref:HTH CENPB-type domain-containing protein n=1 Tax=Lagenidium giganteum TaxID=4803 RepID=A0AAV2Z042_9STRA|nr:TPA: hypothetical protein N0F65_001289 [Lagenidium giganteum]